MKINFKKWYFLHSDLEYWWERIIIPSIEVKDFDRITFLKKDYTHSIICFTFEWKYWFCHCRNWKLWLTDIFIHKNDYEKELKSVLELYSEKWEKYK